MAERLIDWAQLEAPNHVLDAGCGNGSLSFVIGERFGEARVFGIDPSQEYVAYASAGNAFRERVKFAVGNAQQLPVNDSTFDAAVSLLAFNFIPDAAKALRELARVTKPGGRICAAVWDYAGGMQMLRLFWDAAIALNPAAEDLDEKRMPLCRAGELSDLWRQCGLREVTEEPIDLAMNFESHADFWSPFLLGQGPAGAYVRSLTTYDREALAREIERRLPAGSFELTARAWAVRGVCGAAIPGRSRLSAGSLESAEPPA